MFWLEKLLFCVVKVSKYQNKVIKYKNNYLLMHLKLINFLYFMYKHLLISNVY